MQQDQKLIGNSTVIKEIRFQIGISARHDYPIIIHGNTGVGKSLVARLIHLASRRNKETFLVQSCSNLSDALFESDLFGHEKGAFTGASANKIGKMEAVGGGTVLFDGIDGLTLDGQAKLLRFIESGRFFKVGGNKEHVSDVRIITSSNKNLAKEIKTGHFRLDLFFRINTSEIYIAPLKERKEDIPLLVAHILQRENEKNGMNKIITSAGIDKLSDHNYPGNIRELENIIRRAYIYSSTGSITEADITFYDELQESIIKRKISIEQIKGALMICGGNKCKAARKLGISRQSLYKVFKKYNIY